MRGPGAVWVLAVVVTFTVGSCCPYNGVGTRAVTLHSQETGNWCWAGTTQMVIETYDEFVEQCDMANLQFSRTDCCTAGCPKNPACNIPAWPMFTEYGYDFDQSANPLTWAQLKSQICTAKKPMAFGYGPKSGGVGHILVIRGFSEVDGAQDLLLRDPWAPCIGETRSITYQEYSNSPTKDHWVTMYNITPNGS